MKRNSDGETGPAAKRLRPMGDTELRLLVYSKVNMAGKTKWILGFFNPLTCRLSQVAGSIIGKGGSNISKLRTEVSQNLSNFHIIKFYFFTLSSADTCFIWLLKSIHWSSWFVYRSTLKKCFSYFKKLVLNEKDLFIYMCVLIPSNSVSNSSSTLVVHRGNGE